MKLVIATSNKGKLAEMQPILAEYGFDAIPQSAFGFTDAEETGHTFVENALLKARNACRHTGLPALADDSGLIIDALQGAPGLISAHYAGVHGDAKGNIAKVLSEMAALQNPIRTARFYSCIVLLKHVDDPQPIIAEGIWHGDILEAPLGEHGFGYDPIFWDPINKMSAAQLPAEFKNRISHRGQALQQLKQKLHARA
ncbi:MAG: RdgB/HAM1 family non-canonical purine NTP pyrophosphatase [Arenimonas sp.]|nr:RdgB/HAM1 family non-canonical purine NTP pyrophosphatase [Arenimonas sp.]